MLLTLVRKELLSHLLTLRLAVACGVTVALVVLVTFIGSMDYSVRMAQHRKDATELDDKLGAATTWQQVWPNVRLPPQPLSLFALGAEAWVTNNVWVLVSYRAAMPSVRRDLANDFMKSLVPVDVVTVVAVVLSFLAVALGFDAVSGEREAGTLRQLLAQPVPRAQVILAKLLGGWLSLWLSLAVAFVLSLLIAMANPDWSLGAGDGVRLILIFVISCLFLAQVYAASLLVSTLVTRSSTSLILCLFGWLLGGIVWMNLAPFVGEFGMRETPWQTYVDGRRRLWEGFDEDMAAWEQRNPSPGRAYTEGLTVNRVLRFARPEGYEWLTRRSRYRVERLREAADDDYNIRWFGLNDQRAAQARFADRWAILSPWDNYRVLTYRLARTTIADKRFLALRAQEYRDGFVQWLQGHDGFGRRWFTDDPPQQTPMITDPEGVTAEMITSGSAFLQERLAWARTENRRLEAATSRHLDLTSMPRFEAARGFRNLPATLSAMVPGLAVLLLSLAVIVPATVLRFQTYEPHR